MPGPQRSVSGSLVLIAAVVTFGVGAFAYTAGWLTPNRLTSTKLVSALAPPGGPALGHRRNHAKGVCFTGTFEANGNASAISRASMFAAGQYPVVGRLNLATPDPNAADPTVRVRGIGVQISAPDGNVWRMALIDPPVFAVSTPQGFYDLLEASTSKDPEAMKGFIAAHPEFAAFGEWATKAPWTASYAEVAFNSLNAFIFTDGSGAEHAVRWSLRPEARPVPITAEDFAKLGANYLEEDITKRVASSPQRWTLVLTVADPSDPTSDPTKAWPPGRRTVEAGTLVVQKIESEADGPCRDINFDPTILPDGIKVSDDPFPAARSAAYAKSYDLRTSEASSYPRTEASAKP
ncbi:catalase family peroxidase [Rhizobium brockwellii]|uniref:catalase family peroxidase n=1 Tax=Rhizobium TaxID=379 RepID=UPI001031D46C|nr:catalase family peroxidase [Rhizobium leguminosarum]TAY97609.1 catalase family peroxidase [Rhizobium leguminosarum]TAZ08378.1 catalase family peroxidase [Rhizobium leguminosarum]